MGSGRARVRGDGLLGSKWVHLRAHLFEQPPPDVVALVRLFGSFHQHMAGMKPLTEVIAGDFKQGQRLEQQFQMTQGKCYGAIAAGAPGISEMYIRFVVLQPIPGVTNPVLAEDKTTGAQAVLGGKGQCFVWQFPIGVNAKVEYVAQGGQGIAAGRVYVK